MNPGRPNEKENSTSRRNTENGEGGRQPNPRLPGSSPNSDRSTHKGDEERPPPQEDGKCQPEQTPLCLKTTPSQKKTTPSPFSASSTASNTTSSQKCVSAKEVKEQQVKCVPVVLVDLCSQREVSQYQQDGPSTASGQPAAFGRQSTYTQEHEQDAYDQQEDGQQDNHHPDLPDKGTPELNSQRSKSSPVVRPTPRIPQKIIPKQQRTASTTPERPPWRTSTRNICKPPSVYPEPFRPLPPVSKPGSGAALIRQHQSETQMSAHDNQMSAKQSEISARQNQMSSRQSQVSAKQSQASARQSQGSSKQSPISQQSTNQSHPSPASICQPQQSSQVSNFAPNVPAVAPRVVPLFTPARSNDSVAVRGDDNVTAGTPSRKSSERLNVERATQDQPRRPPSRPLHFEDDHVRFDAVNTVCTVGPSQRSSERVHEECETTMQKVTAELAVCGKFSPLDRLCVRVSLGEQLTSDGQRKSFTICEPLQMVPADQAQDDNTEVYATPAATSPRPSIQPEAHKSKKSIPEASAEEASRHEVSSAREEPGQSTRERARVVPSIEDVISSQVVPMPPSIQEILPPPSEEASPLRDQGVSTSSPKTKLPPSTKPESTARPKERPQTKSQDHLDRESGTGIKTNTAENEALNTEFLYYSTVLKNLLPVLSCPEDRCRLVPWVKRLFSPEYCARLLRDKRNRFLLHLALVLCNDEVIGVFLKPPPEGIMPSIDELCSSRYPPAAWECDSAWLDHLEDIPPGLVRMPCPWHSSGCPVPANQSTAPADQSTAATDSTENPTCSDICYPWRLYGASNEASLGWSLDQEFKLLLYLSRPLKPLIRFSQSRQQMVIWMRFLCTVTPECCVALRSRRNDYIKLLLAYCQDDRMTGPFASDPVWGQPLPPLGVEGDAAQPRPFADPASGDVDEFLRTVPVPTEGAFCYVAVDGIPVTPITRPTASASLLQR